MAGRLEAIWLKRAHRGVMDGVAEARVSPDEGLVGSVDRSKRRQVTVLDLDAWTTALRESGGNVPPAERRANLLISGVDLVNSRGRVLRVGDVRLSIGGETTPCERMDALHPGLQEAMRRDWRGGVFAQVLDEGMLRVGDDVSWSP
jgi:MOSC domain-containing protein YiiM